MPHGPAQAVSVAEPTIIHPPGSFGGGASFIPSGWPESIFDMSGSGPFGPILNGVWQSLHTMTVTRYFPRSMRLAVTLDCPGCFVCAGDADAAARSARPAIP